MALKIEVAELGLPAIDGLDVDALAVLVGPERPLQGFAGFADWRLCGAISRAIRSGVFDARHDEALLLPSGGRVAAPRIFAFGLPEVPLPPDRFLHVARTLCEALARAGSEAFATTMPPIAGGDTALAAKLWIEASLVRPVKRQVVLGEARALQRDLTAARNALGVEVEVLAPPSRVELPSRGRPLPYKGAATR